VRRALHEDARVFTMSKEFIFREGRYTQDIALDFSDPDARTFITSARQDCAQAALNFKQESSFLSWVSEKCKIDITSLLAPYLDNFINCVCPEDILKIKKLSDFYIKEKIDFIVVRSSTGRDSAFSLAAANNKGVPKKVCFQHSCTAFEQLSLLMTDVYPFDYYATTDSLSEKYFKLRSDNELFRHCKIVQAPHYFYSLGRPSLKKRSRLVKDKREVIMYAPNEASIGIYNMNTPRYLANWYCNFLKELIGYLHKRQDKIFIFKYRPGANWADRVIVPYLKANNFTNIHIEDKPLISYLHRVDRVVLDYPATGFFESVASGMPTMSLYKRDNPLWDGARDFFGPMLAPFIDAKEAIAHIDDFLASDKNKYIVSLPLSKGDIVDLFLHMKAPAL